MSATPQDRLDESELQALIDERLPAERQAAARSHLAAHPEDAARVEAYRRQREALRSVFLAPGPEARRLRVADIRAAMRRRQIRGLAAIAASVAVFALGGTAGWLARDLAGGSGAAATRSVLAADAVTAFRTFVSEVRHPVEVTVGEQAHLVQWLSNRLGRPLKVPDLAPLGFRLMGGRLLPASEGPAAQFMYVDDQNNRLTIYLRADLNDRTTEFRFAEQGESLSFWWVDDGFGYVVTGRIPRDRLWPVAETVFRQTAPARPARPG